MKYRVNLHTEDEINKKGKKHFENRDDGAMTNTIKRLESYVQEHC